MRGSGMFIVAVDHVSAQAVASLEVNRAQIYFTGEENQSEAAVTW